MSSLPSPKRQELKVGLTDLYQQCLRNDTSPIDETAAVSPNLISDILCVTGHEDSEYIYIDLSDVNEDLLPKVGSTISLQVLSDLPICTYLPFMFLDCVIICAQACTRINTLVLHSVHATFYIGLDYTV